MAGAWPPTQSLSSASFPPWLGGEGLKPGGKVRLDVAFPLDRREGDDSVKVYLGFGNVF